MRRYSKFLQNIPEKQKNARLSILFLAPKFHLVTIIFKQDNFLQKRLISCHDFIQQQHHQAIFLQYIWHLCFMFWIFYISFLLCYIELLNNCQIFKCQIIFSKVYLSVFFIKVFTGLHLNAANFYGTMLFCYTILPWKLDVPRGHTEEEKLYPPQYRKVFYGSSLIIASKTKK